MSVLIKEADVDDRPYYYRLRGKTLGPFDLRQMRQRVAAGQVGKRSALSRDNLDWATGDTFPELFVAERRGPPPSEPTERLTPSAEPWYCQMNGVQQGPHDLAVIQQFVQLGTLSADDYVFKSGQPTWTRVRETAELVHLLVRSPSDQGGRAGGEAPFGEVFCRECGTSLRRAAVICPTCGVPTGAGTFGTTAAQEEKSKSVAALLAFFVGVFGIHHFYLGNVVQGVLYLIFSWTLVPALIAFIECIVFLVMPKSTFDAKYNRRITK